MEDAKLVYVAIAMGSTELARSESRKEACQAAIDWEVRNGHVHDFTWVDYEATNRHQSLVWAIVDRRGNRPVEVYRLIDEA